MLLQVIEPISVKYSSVVSNHKWKECDRSYAAFYEKLCQTSSWGQVRMFQQAHTLTHVCVWVCVKMVSKAVCVCMPCVSRVGESHLQLQMSGVASRAPMWAFNHALLSLDEARAAELKASGSYLGSLCVCCLRDIWVAAGFTLSALSSSKFTLVHSIYRVDSDTTCTTRVV